MHRFLAYGFEKYKIFSSEYNPLLEERSCTMGGMGNQWLGEIMSHERMATICGIEINLIPNEMLLNSKLNYTSVYMMGINYNSLNLPIITYAIAEI